MLVYFVPYLSLLALTSISPFWKRIELRRAVLIVCIGCMLLAGLRYETDNDFDSYAYIFDSITPLTRGWGVFTNSIDGLYLEPPFALLVSMLKSVLPDLWIFLVMAVVSLSIYYRTMVRVAFYPAMGFLIYVGDGFYLREFTQIRFGLAVAIGFAGLGALYSGKIWKHRALSLLASMLHFSAPILVFAQLWTRLVNSRRRVFWVSTILFACAIFGLFNGLVESLAGFDLAPQRVIDHLDTDDAASVNSFTIFAQFAILIWMSRVVESREREFFWVSIYALSFALLCLFSGFDLMRRLSFYFSTGLYVLASLALHRRRYLLVLVLITYSAALFAARLNILNDYQSWIG